MGGRTPHALDDDPVAESSLDESGTERGPVGLSGLRLVLLHLRFLHSGFDASGLRFDLAVVFQLIKLVSSFKCFLDRPPALVLAVAHGV